MLRPYIYSKMRCLFQNVLSLKEMERERERERTYYTNTLNCVKGKVYRRDK